MTNIIRYSSKFKRHYKRVSKDPGWRKVFHDKISIEITWTKQEFISFDFVITCLEKDITIPKYFYAHPITLPKKMIQRLKSTFGDTYTKIECLELHFDGHNGDHLLIYAKNTVAKLVYLLEIGTHSELF
ncbi:hypothetical protein [Lentilactobacillus kisonensis]|uniref:Replication associated protein n=3 Tax=Lentilactobacillus kisonensis TaxID=481722 RepID=H1LI01_9LACO|nr:hypothetical protein [Lentilactobacillus kisonensis]EHO50036.1 hypothetical protein HMPREF9104_02242 [Lentilactobacillus kisonensis F0435]KRL22194.1 hypothetical protein FC98_GL002813 [Lentilactobacillus kisonensis DSM 19906 = JCM 15041]